MLAHHTAAAHHSGVAAFILSGILPILSDIQSAELHQMGATLSLANGANLDLDHLLNS